MIYFKSCIRCKGDLHIKGDFYGSFVQCLQCGWLRDLPDNITQLNPDELSAFLYTGAPVVDELVAIKQAS